MFGTVNTFIILAFLFFLFYVQGRVVRTIKEVGSFRKYVNKNISVENNEEESIKIINDFFSKNKKHLLANAWHQFYTQAKRLDETPEIFDYINREYIIFTIGKRKQVEIVSGLLISFGILGTFFGLKIGLSEFNIDGGTQTGIGNLISGVDLAFTSSLLGIGLSVLWIIIDRFTFHAFLTNHTDNLMNLLNSTFPREDTDAHLKKLVTMQKEQLDSFKTMVTDTLIPDMIDGFKEALNQSVVPHLESNQSTLETMAENTAKQQSESLNTMADHFLESLNDATANHFDKLEETLQKMIEWNQSMFDKTSFLVEKLVDNTEVQTEMGETLHTLSVEFKDYSESLTSFQFEFNTSMEQLNDMESNLKELQETASSTLMEANDRYNVLNEKEETLRTTLEEQMQNLDARMDNLKTYWESSEESLSDLNGQLASSMDQFADHMHQGLERTFDQFDKSLRQALEYLQSSVMGIEDAVIEMPKLIEDFQQNLSKVNELNEKQLKFVEEDHKWRKEMIASQQQGSM